MKQNNSKEKHNNISKYRKKLGYTQKEFAEKLEITQQALSQIENGKLKININIVEKILKEFKSVTFDELLKTNRMSIYITKDNQELLKQYSKEIKGNLNYTISEHELYTLTINNLIKLALDSNIKDIETKGLIKK
ncbi:helix-turn-helix domain-containing protein [Senegalia massiliensis]|uniref:XRE family transcriptional regulator n=1 Tax=Senegalia massiliensis TaxID=1720316 RepID=A0A845R2I6_9CLOT|nr:helix-turn-helix transcriptional regulator [Senegalia massiliensis]NBI07642.1 XRE family transcriptional regulator [Senegalia massiliensis]